MNWRNPGEYTYTEKLTLRQWAWEFLRRSKTYRELWNAYTEFMDFMDKEFEGKEIGDPIRMPIGFFRRGAALGLLNHLTDPDIRADQAGEFKWAWGFGLKISDESSTDRNENPAAVRITFDLTLPLDDQLRLVTHFLKESRKRLDAEGWPRIAPSKLRIRPDLWLIYVRLLDARNAGVSIAEMGRTIFTAMGDPRKSAQNALRRAEVLSESEYQQLLYKFDLSGIEGIEGKGN